MLHFGAWATFLTVVMYTANLWGVLMFIFLMSHALCVPAAAALTAAAAAALTAAAATAPQVELPKQLWHLSRADQRLKRAYNRVGESARKLLSAQESWGAELAKWERMKEAIASESYGAVPSDEPSAVRGESAAGAVAAATQVVPGEGGTSGGPAVQYRDELGHFVREISISPARAGAPLAGAVPGLQTLVDVALVGETGRSTVRSLEAGRPDRRTGGAINVDWSNKDKAQAALEGLHETFRAEAFLWRQVTPPPPRLATTTTTTTTTTTASAHHRYPPQANQVFAPRSTPPSSSTRWRPSPAADATKSTRPRPACRTRPRPTPPHRRHLPCRYKAVAAAPAFAEPVPRRGRQIGARAVGRRAGQGALASHSHRCRHATRF